MESKINKPKARRILVLGINTLPELTGIGRYSGEMIAWLSENSFECTMVSTFPYYPYWRIQEPYSGRFFKKEVSHNGNLVIYRCPFYVPAIPSGIKRVIHEASFFLSAFFVVCRLLFKPAHDEIFCIAPPFHLGFLGLFYRFFKGGKLTYHIQDLQIEAARDLKVLKPESIFKILFKMEKFILDKADVVTTISEGMRRKVQAKITKTVELFPNWSDTQTIFPLENRAELKAKWNFEEGNKIVLYSGSVGEKQGLEVILDIAMRLIELKDIKFVICGTGPYKRQLETWAVERGLTNVFFLPLQESAVFNEFLNMADVHLVLQKADASDLVMPSKLTNILSAGALAVVTANPGTSLYDVIKENRMGLVAQADDPSALQEAIINACREDRSLEKKNARRFAERNLNKNNILVRRFALNN